MFDRIQLKAKAKLAFYRNYWGAVLASFVVTLLTGSYSASTAGGSYINENQSGGNVSQDIQQDLHGFDFNTPDIRSAGKISLIIVIAIVAAIILIRIFVSLTIEVGGCRFFIRNASAPENASTVFSGFNRHDYKHTTFVLLCRDIFQVLWSLLLIIPGIVKHYEYSMIPYILAENPDMDRKEAFALSKQMTDGHKMDLFIMDLSFIGWYLLGALTCGILGLLWTHPYIDCTWAEAYLSLKQGNDDTIIDAEYTEENMY